MSTTPGNGDWSEKASETGDARLRTSLARLSTALEPDDIVLGGGNVKHLKKFPPGCRVGDNAKAFVGGFRLWNHTAGRRRP